jgi:D-lactate dehydrogenase
MKAVAYSIKGYEKEHLIKANQKKHEITLISNTLSFETAAYADGKDAVLVFPGDTLNASLLQDLKRRGVKYIATRSKGIDHIDIEEAHNLGLKIANVQSYSPESTAEHAIALMLSLCRNFHQSQKQVGEYNFSLNNLVGTTLKDKTVGIVGFGETGTTVARVLKAFGAEILFTDIKTIDDHDIDARQVNIDELYALSDIISYHTPLDLTTYHLVDTEAINKMRDGVMLINVSRGAVFNTQDVYDSLLTGKISKLGMDVYEFEHNVFFFNLKNKPLNDELLKALLEHPRVLITPHQAFLTQEALRTIADQTIINMDLWEAGKCSNHTCACHNTCSKSVVQI